MNTLETLRARKAEIERLARIHGARNIRVFGSVARSEDTSDSDIDFLIDMEESRSLLDLVGFKQELEAMLNRSADVLTERGISPYLRKRILAEAIAL
ncbi:MAG: nucleotidyltransferase family protein [Anderseniella sp.]|jgi:predicted nucleotidyltransferase|nr:nucleotidyltransferase family protein [Anderseniella sp.]